MTSEIMVVLHAYQPPYPIQEKFVLDRIVDNCYRPIAENLVNYPKVKFVLNINASLSEMLMEDAQDVLKLLNEAAERGQIEFLNTGAFHPILPIISDYEKTIQVNKNIEINQRLIGPSFQPIGFFPPELAVDNALMKYLAQKKYNYVIIPENSIPVDHTKSIAYMESNGHRLHLIPRDKSLSNHISFAQDQKNLGSLINRFVTTSKERRKPTVIAMDIETYGEHHTDYWKFLFDLLSHEKVQPILSQEFLEHEERHEIEEIVPSSWSTDRHELEKKIPFPLWDDPRNPVHVIQQTHFSLIRQLFEGNGINERSIEDQSTIMAAYHSCQFWWATPGRWSPDMVRKGFISQQKALKLLTSDQNLLGLSDKLSKRLEFTLKNSHP